MKTSILTVSILLSITSVFSQSRGGLSNVNTNLNNNINISFNKPHNNSNTNSNTVLNPNAFQTGSRGNKSVSSGNRSSSLNVRPQVSNVNNTVQRNVVNVVVDNNVQSNKNTNQNVIKVSVNEDNNRNVVALNYVKEIVIQNNSSEIQLEQTQNDFTEVSNPQLNSPTLNLSVNLPKPEITLNLSESIKKEEKTTVDKVKVNVSLEKEKSLKVITKKINTKDYKQVKGNYQYQQKVDLVVVIKNKAEKLFNMSKKSKSKKINEITICYSF